MLSPMRLQNLGRTWDKSVTSTAALLYHPDSKSITPLDPRILPQTLYANAGTLAERAPCDEFEALFSIHLETAQRKPTAGGDPKWRRLWLFVFSFC
jgi:hypothetical protein